MGGVFSSKVYKPILRNACYFDSLLLVTMGGVFSSKVYKPILRNACYDEFNYHGLGRIITIDLHHHQENVINLGMPTTRHVLSWCYT